VTNWENIFDQVVRRRRTSAGEIRKALSRVHRPLTQREIADINRGQQNPFPKGDDLYDTYKPFDPSRWRLPRRPLPASFVDFLCWSDGGEFQNGERLFQFLSAAELRSYLLSYHVPQYMPLSQPFALNGGGCFYLFDMRSPPLGGEYPILFVGCGALGYDEAVVLGDSFERVVKDGSNPEDVLYG
jgi:hypothetical protein